MIAALKKLFKFGVKRACGVDRNVKWKARLYWIRLGTGKRGVILGLYIETQEENVSNT